FFLAGRTAAPKGSELLVDQPLDWTPADPALSLVEIERPDGRVETADVRQGRVLYEKTDRPGLYTVRKAGFSEPLVRFVVNLDRETREGDLSRIDEAEVENVLPARDVTWISKPEPAAKRFQEKVRGKDLTAALSAAVLILFSLESVLTLLRRGFRKQ
ncbi:MAG: hypothetical protein HY548_07445, partial [Elusimicrobia bacterium]|nr:hypothetical protein [Elusimicrobiota bacterium]